MYNMLNHIIHINNRHFQVKVQGNINFFLIILTIIHHTPLNPYEQHW